MSSVLVYYAMSLRLIYCFPPPFELYPVLQKFPAPSHTYSNARVMRSRNPMSGELHNKPQTIRMQQDTKWSEVRHTTLEAPVSLCPLSDRLPLRPTLLASERVGIALKLRLQWLARVRVHGKLRFRLLPADRHLGQRCLRLPHEVFEFSLVLPGKRRWCRTVQRIARGRHESS